MGIESGQPHNDIQHGDLPSVQSLSAEADRQGIQALQAGEQVYLVPAIEPLSAAGHAQNPVALDPEILKILNPRDSFILQADARGVPASMIGPEVGISTNGIRWKILSAKKAYRKAQDSRDNS